MTSETNTPGPAHPAKEAFQQHLLTQVEKKYGSMLAKLSTRNFRNVKSLHPSLLHINVI